jgi:hypothetical protein
MPDTAHLAHRIEPHAALLASRSIELTYTDPFWDARFGEPGRLVAEEDARQHVDHMVLALRADDPRRLTGYARGLQVVLATRGMCSRHLVQHFMRLAQAIGDAGIDDAGPALAYLGEAVAALRHPGAAGELHDDAPRLAALVARHSGAPVASVAGGEARVLDDAETLLSYVADAAHLGRPELFAAHVAWMHEAADRLGTPSGYAHALLEATDDALAHATPEARDAAAPALAAAWERLTGAARE